MIYRQATQDDIQDIISLLIEDDLGKTREVLGTEIDESYQKAFALIEKDSNQLV